MAGADNTRKPTIVMPHAFIAGLDDGRRKREAERLLRWFETVTGLKGQMWGDVHDRFWAVSRQIR